MVLIPLPPAPGPASRVAVAPRYGVCGERTQWNIACIQVGDDVDPDTLNVGRDGTNNDGGLGYGKIIRSRTAEPFEVDYIPRLAGETIGVGSVFQSIDKSPSKRCGRHLTYL